jgi:hypothetical protein
LKGEISRDLKVERLEDAIVEPHPKSKLDYSEMTLLNTIILDKKKGRSVDFPDYLERENQKDNHTIITTPPNFHQLNSHKFLHIPPISKKLSNSKCLPARTP